MSSLFLTAAVTTPLMLGAAALFVFVFTAWSDRREREKANDKGEKATPRL